MKHFISILLAFAVASSVIVHASEDQTSKCYPITAKDLYQHGAPKFEQYPASQDKLIKPAPVDLTDPKTRRFRTVLKSCAKNGPNFAGHYTVVGWGCGTSCVSFAIVDAKTGIVFFPQNISNISGVHLSADEFEPNTQSTFWGLRYIRGSQLLIIVGSINEDENLEGAFYYIFKDGALKPIP